MHNSKEESGQYRTRSELGTYEHMPIDGDMFLQALNGFLVILSCDGEVFFATHTIESYLGFHQSDIVHQSVYELVHSEDREELQRQLMWNSFLPAEQSNITLQEAIAPENSHLLERSFTVRFRCLLDNTSGFLRLDIRGRVKIIYGQNRKTEEPPLGLFAICTPFGPPSLLEIPHKEVMFKSKHKLDLSLVSMDQRGKLLLGYSDAELAIMGGYDLVHYDDLAYVASAHQELLKTGASGMIAYRYQTKTGQWQWLQTSSRLVYKNSKPDFVICTHRPLMEEEGRDLIGKRTMDFKVSYLDAGLTNSYFSDSEQLLSSSTTSTIAYSANNSSGSAAPSISVASGTSTSKSSTAAPRLNRRYKTQLRDFLSTCRSKRKLNNQHHHHGTQLPIAHPTPTTPAVDYVDSNATAAAAAVAVAYSNLNSIYSTSPYAANTNVDNSPLSPYITHPAAAATASNFHQAIYDNRIPYLTATTDNFLHQYRPLGNYYAAEYHHAAPPPGAPPYVSNGFLEIPSRNSPSSLAPLYDAAPAQTVALVQQPPSSLENNKSLSNDCNKIYAYHQQLIDQKYLMEAGSNNVVPKCLDMNAIAPSYMPSPVMSSTNNCEIPKMKPSATTPNHLAPAAQPPPPNHADAEHNNIVAAVTAPSLKLEDVKSEVFQHYSPIPPNDSSRQTVLMWALNHTPQSSVSSNGKSPPAEDGSTSGTPPVILNNGLTTTSSSSVVPVHHQYNNVKKPSYVISNDDNIGDPLKSLAEMNSMQATKWKPDTPPSPKAYYHPHQYSHGSGGVPPSTEHSSCFNTTNGSRMFLSFADKSDRSPLLSISEVTNTLLNQ